MTKTGDEFTKLPSLKKLQDIVSSGTSLLLFAPRTYGHRQLYESLVPVVRSQGWASAWLDIPSEPKIGDEDFSALAQSLLRQIKPRGKGILKEGLREVLFSLAMKDMGNVKITIFLDCKGRAQAENYRRLLSLSNEVLSECYSSKSNRLQIVALDDYSAYFNTLSDASTSELNFLDREHFGHIAIEDLVQCVENLDTWREVPKPDKRRLCDALLEISGGHPIITCECLRFLRSKSETSLEELTPRLKQVAQQSYVLQDLEKLVRDDPEGLSSTAREYRIPQYPETNTPRTNILIENGILQKMLPGMQVRLTPGVITELVDDIFQASVERKKRVGTILYPSAQTEFLDTEIPITEDDFLVCHISDLHVGDEFRFRIDFRGGEKNPSESFLNDLMQKDFDKMNCMGRVGMVICSGDIVGNGSEMAHYSRAEEVIRQIALSIEVPLARWLFLPGNHDVDWKPGTLARKDNSRKVSLENFNNFLRLLGKSEFAGCDFVEIRSKNASRRLLVLGLDSTAVESPETSGIGYINRDALEKASKIIGDFRNKDHTPLIVWAVFHHHVIQSSSINRESVGKGNITVMANAAEILHWAASEGIECLLHGHEHQPCVTIANRWPPGQGLQFSTVTTIGAGSISVNREQLGPIARNQYYVLLCAGKGLYVRSRILSEFGTNFVPHCDLLIPPPYVTGKVT